MTPRKPPRAVAIHLTGAIWNSESPATQLFRPWCVTGCWNSGDFETEREKSLVYISCNWVPKFQLGCVSWSDTFILAAICELWLDCLTWTELKWTDVILCANLPRRCFGLLRRWQFATSLQWVEWTARTTSSAIHPQILRNGTSIWIGEHRAADSAVASLNVNTSTPKETRLGLLAGRMLGFRLRPANVIDLNIYNLHGCNCLHLPTFIISK